MKSNAKICILTPKFIDAKEKQVARHCRSRRRQFLYWCMQEKVVVAKLMDLHEQIFYKPKSTHRNTRMYMWRVKFFCESKSYISEAEI